jgi:hypothetical protein
MDSSHRSISLLRLCLPHLLSILEPVTERESQSYGLKVRCSRQVLSEPISVGGLYVETLARVFVQTQGSDIRKPRTSQHVFLSRTSDSEQELHIDDVPGISSFRASHTKGRSKKICAREVDATIVYIDKTLKRLTGLRNNADH